MLTTKFKFGISFVLSLLPFANIINLLISPILEFGILVSFIKLSRNQEVSNLDFLNEFNSFGKVWQVTLQMFLKILLPIILLFITPILSIILNFATNTDSSFLLSIIVRIINVLTMPIAMVWLIIRAYSLALSLYILHDEPELSSSEIVNKSISLMKGNKFKFFILNLSFIGWAFLTILTFGIGLILLIPYIQVTTVKFYEDLIGSNN
mgnify:CR=1 FL=1